MSAELVLERVHEVVLVDAAARPVEVWCPIVQDWPHVAAEGAVLRCEGCQHRLAVSPRRDSGGGTAAVNDVASADGVRGDQKMELVEWTGSTRRPGAEPPLNLVERLTSSVVRREWFGHPPHHARGERIT